MRICDKCNIELNENNDCPQCRIHYVFVEEAINFYDGYGLKKKDPQYQSKSKKHTHSETIVNKIELNCDRNQLVKRYKREDRLNDEYEEKIQTLDGEIIHECKEKLSEHFGHGNANRKK